MSEEKVVETIETESKEKEVKEPSKGKALAAFICGCVGIGLILLGVGELLSIALLALGIVTLVLRKKAGKFDTQPHKAFQIVSLITGIISIVIGGIIFVSLFLSIIVSIIGTIITAGLSAITGILGTAFAPLSFQWAIDLFNELMEIINNGGSSSSSSSIPEAIKCLGAIL